MDDGLLSIMLDCAVPLHMEEIRDRGGPTDCQMAWVRQVAAWALAGPGAESLVLNCRPHRKGDVARIFNTLAKALAIAAFCPGGVRFAGQHWTATAERRQPTMTTDDVARIAQSRIAGWVERLSTRQALPTVLLGVGTGAAAGSVVLCENAEGLTRVELAALLRRAADDLDMGGDL